MTIITLIDIILPLIDEKDYNNKKKTILSVATTRHLKIVTKTTTAKNSGQWKLQCTIFYLTISVTNFVVIFTTIFAGTFFRFGWHENWNIQNATVCTINLVIAWVNPSRAIFSSSSSSLLGILIDFFSKSPTSYLPRTYL